MRSAPKPRSTTCCRSGATLLVDVFGYFTLTNGDAFVPLQPERLFDTRTGHGVAEGKLGHLQSAEIQVSGLAGVPSFGATAVVMNLTVTEPNAPGFLRLTPAGVAAADTSNVNFFANDTVPNLVICRLGVGGRLTLDSVGDAKHALGDVFGYFGGDGCKLVTLAPTRILDTRIGLGAPVAPIGLDVTLQLVVGGRAGVPDNAEAVALNVTATNAAGASFVTVWPYGSDQPNTSNLNIVPGQTVANLVICQLGAEASLSITSPPADCDVIADVLGYFIA